MAPGGGGRQGISDDAAPPAQSHDSRLTASSLHSVTFA